MRKYFLATNLLGLLTVHAFACGALNLSPREEGYVRRFLGLCAQPFFSLSPLGGAVLAAGLTLLWAAAFIVPGREGGGRRVSWCQALSAAFLVSALTVAAVVALVLAAARSAPDPSAVGILYTSGVLEACVSVLLAGVLFCFQERTAVYLPALVVLFVGVAALGAMYFLGSGAFA